MYNIYTEEKKLSELDKKNKIEDYYLINKQNHQKKTTNLALNYQKRIKKFIIDVNIYII